MPEEKQNKFDRNTILVGIFSILGVCAGSIISGLFNLQDQKATLHSRVMEERGRGSQYLVEKITELSSQYLDLLFKITSPHEIRKMTEKEYKEYLERFESVSHRLALYTSPMTSNKLVESVVVFSREYAVIVPGGEDAASEARLKMLPDLVAMIHMETKRLLYNVVPGLAGEDIEIADIVRTASEPK